MAKKRFIGCHNKDLQVILKLSSCLDAFFWRQNYRISVIKTNSQLSNRGLS